MSSWYFSKPIAHLRGDGKWPDKDPFGKSFSCTHHPRWFKLSGQDLAGPFRAVLDGLQGDQAYLHDCFALQRYMARSVCGCVWSVCLGLTVP